jgi:hypothetical protein
MKNRFKEWLSALRVRLGWGGLSESRLSPAHGWLLPTPGRRDPRAPGKKAMPEASLGSGDGCPGGSESLP